MQASERSSKGSGSIIVCCAALSGTRARGLPPSMPEASRQACQASLLHLPQELHSRIWSFTSCSAARCSLMSSARSIQASFGSSVASLQFRLTARPFSAFKGLHSSVRPRKVTVQPAIGKDAYRSESLGSPEGAEAYSPSFRNFSTGAAVSGHWDKVEELTIVGFHLGKQDATCAEHCFENIKVLRFKHVTADPAALAEMLGQCTQLQELHITRTLLTGFSEPLKILSKFPSLSLTLDLEEKDLPEGTPQLAFLQHLGSSLTSLSLRMGDDQDSNSAVLGVLASSLRCLKRLSFETDNGAFPDHSIFLTLSASPLAHTLTSLSLEMEVPSPDSLAVLMGMPALEMLADAALEGFVDAEIPQLQGFSWPEGKAPMSVHLTRGSTTYISALPLQHVKSFRVGLLSVPLDGREEKEATLKVLLSAAAKCPEFVIRGIMAMPLQDRSAGLSPLIPLGRHCPIKISHGELYMLRLEMQASDIQGIAAAWGHQLEMLRLDSCLLSPCAWVALKADSFKALSILEISNPSRISNPHGLNTEDFGIHLTALCMDWPADRRLNIVLTGWEGAEEMAENLHHMLNLRGREYPHLVSGVAIQAAMQQAAAN